MDNIEETTEKAAAIIPETVESSVDTAVDTLSQAADTLIDAAKDATDSGDSTARYSIENIADTLRGIEGTLKQLSDDITLLKTKPVEEEIEQAPHDAVDFVADEIEDSPAPPEKLKRGIRAKRKQKRGSK